MSAVVTVYARPVSQDPTLADMLDSDERERSARRGNPARFVTAHALLRTVVAQRTGQSPSDVRFDRRCMTCGSTAHGKPVVSGHPLFHAPCPMREALPVAISDAGEVGVDVEEVADADHEGFEASTLAAEEVDAFGVVAAYRLAAARAQVWSRKEAVLKATGHGLVVDPRDVVVSGPDEDAALWLARRAPRGLAGSPARRPHRHPRVCRIRGGAVRRPVSLEVIEG